MTNSILLKFSTGEQIRITKPYTTVGIGSGYDVSLPGSTDKILFAIQRTEDSLQLIPGEEKVSVNGKAVPSKASLLKSCDRIEWKDQAAVLIEAPALTDAPAAKTVTRAMEILESVASMLTEDSSLDAILQESLESIVDTAEAEEGYLISEIDPETRSEWAILAAIGTHHPASRRRELISNTVLNQAIEKRVPVYIESLIGHPLANQASLMDTRVFSIACLPLRVGQRVFGALYLSTRTPGRSIRKEALNELTTLSTQIALLMASQSELRRMKNENKALRKGAPSTTPGFVFKSKSMEDLDQRLTKLAASQLNVLVRGETGTGKELIAREFHMRSSRAKGPFVVVNCAAIPPSLIESVLFGHTKGAFTGAQQNRVGKFLLANNGTIFLDEIGELPLELQSRLLRVLQEKEIEAVGSDRPVRVDFRVVAATHQDLETAVSENRFRQDLFFRLNGATLAIPPLRERGEEEILLLSRHFLDRHSQSHQLSEGAKAKLSQYRWPGNVRELEQVIARGAVLASGDLITEKDLEVGDLSASQSSSPLSDGLHGDLKAGKQAYMKSLVEKTLKQFDGNRAQTAKHLGISERTLYRLLASDSSDNQN